MPTVLPAESRTLVENVRWETYVALSEDRRGSVPRMTYDRGAMELMFAAMGVPEVWRHDGKVLRLFRLEQDGYREDNHSAVLPGFPVAVAQSILSARLQRGEIHLLREFRAKIEVEQ